MAGISAREIKHRIRSMESTRQITKAMEMAAAAKLRRAQVQLVNSRPYFEALRSTLDRIVEANRDLSSPYLQARPVNKVLYIVIAGDRGLAGGYNSNILKLIPDALQNKTAMILPIGKKSLDFFRSRKNPVWTEACAEAASLGISDCFSVARELSSAYLEGVFDEVHIAYTHFTSALSQIPTTMQLLPLVGDRSAEPRGSRCDTIFEPSLEEAFASIVPEYLGGILYGALCESRAAEQAARRTAMDSAASNADDRIDALRRKFNRTRQAAITQEITEIVAGAQ